MPALLIFLVVFLLFLFAVLLFRTAVFGKSTDIVEPVSDLVIDKRLVAEHLSQAVQYATVADANPDPVEHGSYRTVQTFLGLHRTLQNMYPRLHRTLHCEVIQGFSLLYSWPGSEPDLKPILLMAHMDVVPVEEGTEGMWSHAPFSGDIADGYVWGRGTLDFKCGVVGIMEAVEGLLRAGYTPRRTIFLAFGHDEEIGGLSGARRIASVLKSRGVEFESVLDEGGAVTKGIIPGVDCPVALVGLAEKGYVSLDLAVEAEGGHSSMPGKENAIGKMSRALTRLAENPMPAHLDQVMNMFEYLAGVLPFSQRMVIANKWLFGGVLKRSLENSPKMGAMIRSTIVPTIISAGVIDNVLPRKARAVVNCRIYPGDTIYSVIEHARKVIGDPQVSVSPFSPNGKAAVETEEGTKLIHGWNPPAVTPSSSPEYACLVQTIGEVFPEALPAPYLMLGTSDSRHYAEICPNIFRFLPFTVELADLDGVHGINERLSLDNCAQMVRFYIQWIRNHD